MLLFIIIIIYFFLIPGLYFWYFWLYRNSQTDVNNNLISTFILRYYDFYRAGDFVLYRNIDRAFEVGVTMTCIINTSVAEPREVRRIDGGWAKKFEG